MKGVARNLSLAAGLALASGAAAWAAVDSQGSAAVVTFVQNVWAVQALLLGVIVWAIQQLNSAAYAKGLGDARLRVLSRLIHLKQRRLWLLMLLFVLSQGLSRIPVDDAVHPFRADIVAMLALATTIAAWGFWLWIPALYRELGKFTVEVKRFEELETARLAAVEKLNSAKDTPAAA